MSEANTCDDSAPAKPRDAFAAGYAAAAKVPTLDVYEAYIWTIGYKARLEARMTDVAAPCSSHCYPISRAWAMPKAETFDVEPIRSLVDRYLAESSVSVDPFARNTQLATHTNDLNPETKAKHHLDAYDFLVMLKEDGVRADLVILDPPYGPRQIVDCYNSIGIDTGTASKVRNRMPTQRPGWKPEKEIIASMQQQGDKVICCGWNSNGMGKKRGYRLIELVLVAHGGSRNDTIVTVEEKVCRQRELFG